MLTYLIFVLANLIAAGYFIFKRLSWSNELKMLYREKIHGKIVDIKDLTKGTYSIKLSSKTQLPDLLLGWEIKKYSIQIGDSLSKESNSNVIRFYKIEEGVWKKTCEYEIAP